MTKSKKSLIVGAALAGLLASGSAVQASNLLTGARSGLSAQDQGSDTKSDKKAAKDKHACKGQNSCKGKGGCKSSDNLPRLTATAIASEARNLSSVEPER